MSFPKIQSATSGSSQVILRNEFGKSHSYSGSRGTACVDIKGNALRSFRGTKQGRTHGSTVYAWARPRMAFSFPVPPSLFFTWATWRRVLATGDSCRGLIGRYLACRVWFRMFLNRGEKESIRNIDETLEEELLVKRIPQISGRTILIHFDFSLSLTVVTGLSSHEWSHGHWSRDFRRIQLNYIWTCS